MTWQLILEEWTNFAIRWIHVISGIAWIGSSFYFVHLDLSLNKEGKLPELANGQAWQVHGGGFYHMVKYMVAPPQMPAELTWFKWEAYSTWISGFFLLCVLYFAHADLYLVDKTVWDLPPWGATLIGLGGLVVGWIAYDLLCRSALRRNDYALLAAFFVYLVVIAYVLTKVFSGRGAFIELGAIIGTAMVANVAMVIIPNQRKVVAALIAGQTPDPALGATGRQRSLHNNYLTLPVLFLMLANHYPLSFASRFNWVIAALVLVMGGIIRYFYNTRHAGKGSPWWAWGVAAACMVAIMWLSSLGPSGAYATADAMSAPSSAGAAIDAAMGQKPNSVTFAQVDEIVTGRCAMCHAKEPAWEGLASPPKGVLLDSPGEIVRHASNIALQAVYTHAMPPGGNITEISDDERRILAAWIAAGAPAE